MKKTIYHYKNGEKWTTEGVCHPQKLAMSSKYIYPYWYDAIKNVINYEKQRGLADIHKFCSDDRILRGLNLYRKEHIKDITVTTANGGDVRAVVLSQDKKKEYTVIIKNYLPETLPQYNYEREYYISNLVVTCSCNDFMLTRYRSNASIFCVHIMCVLWYLIDKFDMPKIFVTPEERMLGYQKSDVEEIATDIRILPLVKFRYFINILLMKQFRNMGSALALSLHKVNNLTDKEDYKPIWLTIVSPKEIIRMIKAMVKVLNSMCDRDEQYEVGKKDSITKKQVIRWVTWSPRDVALLRRYYPTKGTNIPELRKHHTQGAIRLKAHRLEIRHYRKNKNNNKYITKEVK